MSASGTIQCFSIMLVCYVIISLSCILSVSAQSKTCHRRLVGDAGIIPYPDNGGQSVDLPKIYEEGVNEETTCIYFTLARYDLLLDFGEIEFEEDSYLVIELNERPDDIYAQWGHSYYPSWENKYFIIGAGNLTRILIPKGRGSFSLAYSAPQTEPPLSDYGEDYPIDCMCFKWSPGDWTECSSSCGGGTTSRTPSCVHDRDERCYQYPEVEPCNIELCLVYCQSELLGVGVVDTYNYVPQSSMPPLFRQGLRDKDCVFYSKPGESESLEIRITPTFNAPFFPVLIESHDDGQNSSWQLIATIGGDFSYGPYMCTAQLRIKGMAYIRIVFSSDMLNSRFIYNHHDCKCPDEIYTEWTPCSVTCGGGKSYRTCGSELNPGCLRDFEEISCNENPCEEEHIRSFPWTSCSTSCVGGTRMRFRVAKDFDFIERQPCGEYLCKGKRSLSSDADGETSLINDRKSLLREFRCPDIPTEMTVLNCNAETSILRCRFQCKTGYVPRFLDFRIYPEFEAECRTFSTGEGTWLPAIHRATCLSKDDIFIQCLDNITTECGFREELLIAWFDGYDEKEKQSIKPLFAADEMIFKFVEHGTDKRISVVQPSCVGVWAWGAWTDRPINFGKACLTECGKKCGGRERIRLCMTCNLSKSSPCVRLDASVS